MRDWKTFRFPRNRNDVIQRARRIGVIAPGSSLDHINPRVECACGRTTQADMFVKLGAEWVCDGCWTRVRRQGRS